MASPSPHNGRAPGGVPGNVKSPSGMSTSGRSTRSSNTKSPSPAEADMGAAMWQKYRSIKLVLSNLPVDITTLEVWRAMSNNAHVVFVDLLQNRDGKPMGRAVVRIEPPPRNHPWPTWELTIRRANGQCPRVLLRFDGGTLADGSIRSPLNNTIPDRAVVATAGFSFGTMVKESTMMEMRRLQDTGRSEIRTTVDFQRRWLKVQFSVKFDADTPRQWYEMLIKFSHLQKLYRVQLDDGEHWGILIPLRSPPQFFRKSDDVAISHDAEKPSWSESDLWLRQTNIMSAPWLMKDRPTVLNKTDHFIDIGRWTTYRLDLTAGMLDIWARAERALRDFNIKTEPMPKFSTVPPGESSYWTIMSQTEDIKSAQDALALLDSVHLPFDVRYQLEVCISHGVLNEHSIDVPFLEKLQALSVGSERAKWLLESIAEDNACIYDPMSIFKNERAMAYYPSTTRLPAYCTVVRKALVTPTTIYLNSPTVETTNRVLREYRRLNDHFLRVQFTDELTLGKVYPNADSRKDDEVYTQVFRALKNGIIVGDRHYHFLAFGNSQLRENGAYFFCPTANTTCESIREWMGNLKDIRCVAKYTARMGQCFSTTRQIQGINVPQIKAIPDIESGGYCFTDGVGKISALLANLIGNDLKLDDTPSAFQFRMGGCKGVLTLCPDIGPYQVHIRKSQAKFEAAYNGLEIIRWSTYATATLNRQTITILSTLGVSDSAFRQMLSEQLNNYDRAMRDGRLAMSLLGRYVDENQTTLAIAQMIFHGFMDAREPFVWTLLRLWRSWSVKALKEKARIIVEKSAFVLGCVDETNTLRGHLNTAYRKPRLDRDQLPQIFLQIPDSENAGEYKVITGLCVVGRNPSLHPGDIRVVEAVDTPALRHLKNVVVFPQNGDRDIPSMCSGGDLDGDDFFVIWDQSLIPPQWNYEPMNYVADPPVTLDRDVEISDVIRFFVLYMKNDSLPHIALAHLAQADWLQDHAKNPKCLELAALHSKAVDYVKSGNPATMPKRLRPRAWPHFMERSHNSYRSTSILGMLYDQVQRIEFHPEYEMPFDRRILDKYKPDSETLKKARRLKTKYDTAMRRVMAQAEVSTEFEIFTTFVLSNPRVGTSYKMQETIGREAAALRDRFVAEAVRDAGAQHRRDQQGLWPFVAAMYQVTNEEVRIALHEARAGGHRGARHLTPRTMPLLSFPWIFHSELGQMASGKRPKFRIPTLAEVVPQEKPKPAAEKPADSEGESEDDGELEGEEARPPVWPQALPLEELVAMDYARTPDGRVIHRGEVLNLFGGADGDDELGEGFVNDGGGSEEEQEPTGEPGGLPAGAGIPADGAATGERPAGEPAQTSASRPTTPVSAAATPVDEPQKPAASTPPAGAPPSPVGAVSSTDTLVGQEGEDEGEAEEMEFEEEELEIEEETALERMQKLGF